MFALFAVVLPFMLCVCSTTHPGAIALDYPPDERAGWKHYGECAFTSPQTVALGSLRGDETNIATTGTIVEVCKVKGCWMRVKDDTGKEIFVKFKDYAFFVPRNAAGYPVIMHGQAQRVTMSVAELRHYAMDAGKSPEVIATITEPATQVTFLADSVYIEGEGLAKPWPDS
jgi:hypothetical protein